MASPKSSSPNNNVPLPDQLSPKGKSALSIAGTDERDFNETARVTALSGDLTKNKSNELPAADVYAAVMKRAEAIDNLLTPYQDALKDAGLHPQPKAGQQLVDAVNQYIDHGGVKPISFSLNGGAGHFEVGTPIALDVGYIDRIQKPDASPPQKTPQEVLNMTQACLGDVSMGKPNLADCRVVGGQLHDYNEQPKIASDVPNLKKNTSNELASRK